MLEKICTLFIYMYVSILGEKGLLDMSAKKIIQCLRRCQLVYGCSQMKSL